MRWQVNVAQAARTPMDKESSRGIRDYVRKLHQAVDGMTPWDKNDKLSRLKALKGKSLEAAGDEALKASEKLVKEMSQ